MPVKNRNKIYVADTYYHLYNRGVEKRDVFRDDEDYRVFLNLLKRSLDKEVTQDLRGRDCVNYYGQIELVAYCLMPNHFHLFVYQQDEKGMTKLLRSVMIPYGMYFNEKYKRVGPVFQDRFKAVMVNDDAQLWHISRYIHLNPIDLLPGPVPGNKGKKYIDYPYSSLKYYLGEAKADWVMPEKIMDMFDGKADEYQKFLEDWEDYREVLKQGLIELAG